MMASTPTTVRGLIMLNMSTLDERIATLMEAIHTYALDGLCLDSVMYGNDVASLTAVDTQGAEAAYAQVRKADQVKIQQDRSDL